MAELPEFHRLKVLFKQSYFFIALKRFGYFCNVLSLRLKLAPSFFCVWFLLEEQRPIAILTFHLMHLSRRGASFAVFERSFSNRDLFRNIGFLRRRKIFIVVSSVPLIEYLKLTENSHKIIIHDDQTNPNSKHKENEPTRSGI